MNSITKETDSPTTGLKLGPIGGVVLLTIAGAGAYFSGLIGWFWHLLS